jgi:hypothetical protein
MKIQTFLFFGNYFTVFWEFNPETNEYCVFAIFRTRSMTLYIRKFNCLVFIYWLQNFNLGLKKYLWFRFPTDPIFFCRPLDPDPISFFQIFDHVSLFCPGGCRLFIQRAKMVTVVTLIYWTKLPKFVYWKHASLVNIDVEDSTANHPAIKTAETMKKIFKKKFTI